jgi:hypothetical protein
MSSQTEQPSEEELRAAYEAELSRITSAEMILQSAVSLLNLGGRRLGPIGDRPAPGSEGERDLGQVRDAVDGVRALLEILERSTPAQELRPLRDALSQLQMAYARAAQAGGGAEQSSSQSQQQPPAAQAQEPAKGPAEDKAGPGPAESSGRLWVPGR